MAGNGPFTIRQSFDIALPEARREDGHQDVGHIIRARPLRVPISLPA